MHICEATGAWAVRVAASDQRQRFVDASAALDVVGRHRLAATRAHLGSAVVGVTHEVLSTAFLQAPPLEKGYSCDTPRMVVPALPDLNELSPDALRALLVTQHEQLISTQEQLQSRDREIEHLKLLLAKLHRMQFGRKSEKLTRQIEQLELRLEELQSHASEKDSKPTEPVSVPAAWGTTAAKPARRA